MKTYLLLVFAEYLKQFLSKRTVTRVILISAIINRLLQVVFFYNIRVDASYQLLATENFLHGHGLSLAYISNHDLSAIQYQTLINWPPGYSLLIAPLFVLTGHNYVLSGILLDFLFAAILIYFTRKILHLYYTPLYLINIYTLFSSFFIYYFYFIASSDSATISIFCVGLYYLLQQVHADFTRMKYTFITGICFSVCALIKYLFIPIVLVMPIIYLAKSHATKNVFYKKCAIILWAFLLITIAGVLLFQKWNAGTSLYISSTGRGFFPKHLLETYPFLLAGFLRPETISEILPKNLFRHSYISMQIANVLVFLFIIRYSYLQFRNFNIPGHPLFIAFLLISTTTLGLLSLLSLTVSKEEILPGWLWTYVEEARYYGLVVVLLHLLAFAHFSFLWKKTSGVKKNLYSLFFILMLVPEFSRGIYFTSNRIKLFTKEEYSWQYEDRFQKFAESIIQKIRKQRPKEKIVVAGSSYYFNHRIALYSHIPILNSFSDKRPIEAINSKTKTTLLLVLEQKDIAKYQSIFNKHESLFFGKFDNFYFYSVYVGTKR